MSKTVKSASIWLGEPSHLAPLPHPCFLLGGDEG
jgi:hypothetical protein